VRLEEIVMKERMSDRMSDGVSEATEQGRRLMESAKDAAERAGSYAQASVHRLSGRAQNVAGELVDDARTQVERFTGRDLDAWTADVRRFVQDRPLQAIAITIGVGYILGKILKRG
jgi:ElaB/YqjD/DUF883 family membrane-anchored ribosome-binding protein